MRLLAMLLFHFFNWLQSAWAWIISALKPICLRNLARPQVQKMCEMLKEWWKSYQDEKLNELVDLSLKNNTNIALAVARIEEADANMREVGGYLFPQVDFSADATRSKVTELGAFPTFGSPIRNNYSFGLSTSYEIDFWGKLKRNKEAAAANALASRNAKETVELSLVGLVASNYLQLRGLDAQIAVTKINQASRKEALALNQRRMAGGVASALEVSQAEVSVSNLEAQLIELTRLRALSLHQLAVLTGALDLQLGSWRFTRVASAANTACRLAFSFVGKLAQIFAKPNKI